MAFRSLVFTLFVLFLTGCSLPGSTPEIEVIQLPTSTSLPTLPQEPQNTCPVGNWIMPTDTLDLLVVTMFPSTSSFLRIISGQLSMSFTPDGLYRYAGEYLMHVDSGPGQYSEAQTIFSTTGTYTSLGSKVTFTEGTSESQMLACTTYKDGALYTIPCDTVMQFSLLPPSETPFRCSQNRLEIDIPSPSGTIITMFFER